MRIAIIDSDTDIDTLGARLLGTGVDRLDLLTKLRSLNPHVDFAHVRAGTVLLVPDEPRLKPGETRSVDGDAFKLFEEQVRNSVKEAAARASGAQEALAEQRKEVIALTQTAAVKRMVQAEPGLKERLDAAVEIFRQDQQQAGEIAEALQALEQDVTAELAALGRLLG